MKVQYSKKFLKQLSKVPLELREKIEKFVFEDLQVAQSISESGKIERMTAYINCYKARFGSYRIGMIQENDILILKAVMDRKEIYKFFP